MGHRRNQRVPDQIGEPKVVSKELLTKMENLKKKIGVTTAFLNVLAVALILSTTNSSWQIDN